MELKMSNKILDYLHKKCFGKTNSIKRLELANIFNIPLRMLQQELQALRKNGIPVGWNNRGIYYANDGEAKDIIKNIEAMAKDLLFQASKIQKRLQEQKDLQTKLF